MPRVNLREPICQANWDPDEKSVRGIRRMEKECKRKWVKKRPKVGGFTLFLFIIV